MTEAMVKCRGRGNKDVLFQIRDLEQDVNEEEIKRSLVMASGESEECISVKALRPAFGCTQTARVMLLSALRKRLNKLPRIKIGWVSCRIIHIEEELRCYRCWELGLIAARCTGVDRKTCCFKCGRQGHLKADC